MSSPFSFFSPFFSSFFFIFFPFFSSFFSCTRFSVIVQGKFVGRHDQQEHHEALPGCLGQGESICRSSRPLMSPFFVIRFVRDAVRLKCFGRLYVALLTLEIFRAHGRPLLTLCAGHGLYFFLFCIKVIV